MTLSRMMELEDKVSMTAKAELKEIMESIGIELSVEDQQFFIIGFKKGVQALASRLYKAKLDEDEADNTD